MGKVKTSMKLVKKMVAYYLRPLVSCFQELKNMSFKLETCVGNDENWETPTYEDGISYRRKDLKCVVRRRRPSLSSVPIKFPCKYFSTSH